MLLDINWMSWRLAMEKSEKMFSFGEASMRRRNIEFLLSRLQPDQTVMDIGCNQGHISALMAQKVKRVMGVDHDDTALQLARSQYTRQNLDFRNDDAFNALAQTEKFDVAVLSHILEHLDHPDEFLKKLAPHVTYIYIEVPDLDANYLNHYRILLNANYQYTDNDHIWEFDRVSLEELFTRCGLEIEAAEHRYGLLKYWCRSTLNDDTRSPS